MMDYWSLIFLSLALLAFSFAFQVMTNSVPGISAVLGGIFLLVSAKTACRGFRRDDPDDGMEEAPSGQRSGRE